MDIDERIAKVEEREKRVGYAEAAILAKTKELEVEQSYVQKLKKSLEEVTEVDRIAGIEARERHLAYGIDELKRQQEECERERTEVLKLKKSLHDQTNEAKAIISGADEVKKELAELRTQANTAIEESNQVVLKANAEAMAILKDASDHLEMAQEKNRHADMVVAKSVKTADLIASQNDDLTAKLSALVAENEAKQSDLDGRDLSLRAQESNLAARIAEFEGIKHQSSETIGNAETVLTTINSKKEELYAEKASLEALRTELVDKESAIEAKLVQLKEQRETFKGELEHANNLMQQAQEIKNDYLKKEVALTEAVKLNTQRSNELAVLETTVRNADRQLKQDQTKLRQAQAALSATVKES